MSNANAGKQNSRAFEIKVMVQRIGMITIVVPEYEDGLAFFQGILGWRLICDEDQGRKRWVVVAPDAGPHVLLAKATSEAQVAAIGAQTGDRVGFFLHTDAFDADHERMVRAGVLFREAPRTEPYGKVAVFEDPWGNAWDLLELTTP